MKGRVARTKDQGPRRKQDRVGRDGGEIKRRVNAVGIARG